MASPAHGSETHPTVSASRKNFMYLTMAAVLGIISLGYVGGAIAYLVPRKGEGSRPQKVGALSASGIGDQQFSAGVAGPFVYDATGRGDAQGVFVVQKVNGATDAANILVLEQTCRHLGCPVAWVAGGDTGTFICPCHGSVFSKDGGNISGPAPAPLYKHDFQVRNGELWVQGRQA